MLIKNNVELSQHALLQIGYRGISIQEILDCIDKPDLTVQQSPDRFRAICKQSRKGKKYLLIVIYEKRLKYITIITTFITSKITKYI